MTKFKVGDRVRFTHRVEYSSPLDPWRPGNTGTITGGWYSAGSGEALGYRVSWDGNSLECRHHAKQLAKVEPEAMRAFVGPRPEPVEAPKVVLPFRAVGTVVKDADGNRVTAVYGDLTSDTDDGELAGLVAKLLNKHFGVE